MKIFIFALREIKELGQRVLEIFIFYFELTLGLATLFCFIEIILSAIDKTK